MRMVAHILLKDLRRFWLEIGAFLLTVAAWALQEAHPSRWIEQHAESAFPIGLFVIWFFLIIRAIQGESLVGDREFWQTRPYVWWQLLLAKASFLAIALSIPLTLAQIYLLAASGVHWKPGILPGLFWLQMEFAVLLILPAVALASLTETIVQWVLTLVVIGLLMPVVSWLPWSRLQQILAGSEDLASRVGIVVVGTALATAIIIQYRSRHLMMARIIFAASVAFIPLAIVFASSSIGRSLAYPGNRGDNPLQFAVARVETAGTVMAAIASYGSELDIPLGNVSVLPDTIVQVEGMRISLSGENGWRWNSDWQSENLLFTPSGQPERILTSLPNDIAARVAGGGAASRAELAVAVYRLSPERRIETGQRRFAIPGGGVCAWPVLGAFEIRSLRCAEALRGPDLMMVRIDSSESTCRRTDGTRLPPGHYATAYQWDSGPGPADFDPNPVHKFDLAGGFGVWFPAISDTTEKEANLPATVCPGTPLHLEIGTLVSRMRIGVDLGQVDRNNLHSTSLTISRNY